MSSPKDMPAKEAPIHVGKSKRPRPHHATFILSEDIILTFGSVFVYIFRYEAHIGSNQGGQEHHRLGNDPAGAPRSQQAARVAVVTVEKVLLSQSTSQPTLLAKTNAYAQAGTAVDHAAVKTDEGYRTGPRGGRYR